MKVGTYKIALSVAVTMCVALAALVAYLLVGRLHGLVRVMPQSADVDPVIASGTAVAGHPGPAVPDAPANAEPALVPVQISPQRMQEIGVTTAVAEIRTVSNDLHVPGNVEVDEQPYVCADTLSGVDSEGVCECHLPVRA